MTGSRFVPPVPDLPQALQRKVLQHPTRRGEEPRDGFVLQIETATPILGGAAQPREIDDIDIIRVPTIRGHLRFWWRALYGGQYVSATDMSVAESALWGRATSDAGGRSAVEVGVKVLRGQAADTGNVAPNSKDGYALWPARGTTDGGMPAPRYREGIQIELTVTAPQAKLPEVSKAIRAWLLFGGYGSRTRRGVGALKLVSNRQSCKGWLPEIDYIDELKPDELGTELHKELDNLFDFGIFKGTAPLTTFPVLTNYTLVVGTPGRDAVAAWHTALGWLKQFRQGIGVARPAGQGRPGRSYWPEPDKLRLLTGKHGHTPRYTDRMPAWPRAEFGLPIVGRFTGPNEPPDFQITWQDRNNKVQSRMASPLILKPLAVFDPGNSCQFFLPCLLWLTRTQPDGCVVVTNSTGSNKVAVPHSGAAFGTLAASAAEGRQFSQMFRPMAGKQSVKQAFVDWVVREHGGIKVSP